MEDWEIRAALDRQWAASDANDLEGEHRALIVTSFSGWCFFAPAGGVTVYLYFNTLGLNPR